MRVPEWVRGLWHPQYGHYGGKNRRCESLAQRVCPLPVDEMDVLFAKHDSDLRVARTVYSEGVKRDTLVKKADSKLALGLHSLPAWRGYKHRLYGPFYRHLAMIPFRK